MARSRKYRRRSRKRRSRRRRRPSKKRLVRTTYRKLRDRKTNTAIERAIVRVHKIEKMKDTVISCFRRFLFSPFDMTTNVFGPAPPLTGVVSMNGFITDIDSITKADIEFVTNVPPSEDNPISIVVPMQEQDEQKDGGGLGQGMENVTSLNTRRKDKVRVHSLSFGIRCLVDGIEEGANADEMDGCWLYYWIGKVRDDRFRTDPNYLPEPREILRLPKFGYDSRFDLKERQMGKDQHKKTYARGKIFLRHRRNRADIKYRQVHAKVNTYLNFQADDQNGELRTDASKICLVVRSNVPDSFDNAYKPKIWAYSKLRYSE